MRFITLAAFIAFSGLVSRAAAPPATAPARGAVTAEEAKALAAQIDAGAAKADLSALAAAFDEDELFNRIFQGLELSPQERAGFRAGGRVALGFTKQIEQTLKNGGTYRLLRIRNVGGDPRPVFRLISPQGVNYHELRLYRDRAGKPRVADMHVFIIGDTLSQNMRTSFISVMAQKGSKKVTKEAQEMASAAGTIAKLRQLIATGKAAEARAEYQKLPESVRSLKFAAMSDVQIGSMEGDRAYLAAIDRYRKKFPGGAEIELMSIDALTLQKDYKGALAAVDRADKSLGGDPYFDAMRGNIELARGDADAARKLYRQAVKAVPYARDVYLAQLNVELPARNYDAVAELLSGAEKNAGVVWGNIESTPDFADFVKSPQYAKWKAHAATPTSPAR